MLPQIPYCCFALHQKLCFVLFCYVLFCFLTATYFSPPTTFLMASCKDAVTKSMLASSWVLMLGGTLMLLSPIWCLLRACSVHHSTLNFWAVLSAQIVHFIFACFSVWAQFMHSCTRNVSKHFALKYAIQDSLIITSSQTIMTMCRTCFCDWVDNLSTIRNCANRSVWEYLNIS